MRILVALLLALAPCFADLRTNGKYLDVIDYYSDVNPNQIGDTPHFTAWTGASSGGNWNGGRVFGSFNDGQCDTISSSNLGFLEATVIDWTTKGNTHFSCTNKMSGYGGTGVTNFPAGWADGNSWKSYNPFSYNGKLYWFVYRQDLGPTYTGRQSTILTSPNYGVNWCNASTYAAHSGSPGCDSANWSATGDAPADNTKMAFGVYNATTNPMTRPMTVQFCQDETCTGMPFNADNFLYFVTMDGNASIYATCVAKSDTSIMDATQWWYWTGGNANCGDAGSWSHTAANAVQVQNSGVDHYDYPSSVVYLAGAGMFMMTSYDGDGSGGARSMFLISQYPWGPWKRFSLGTDTTGAFLTTNLAFVDTSTAGVWQFPAFASNYTHSGSASFYIYKYRVVLGGPSTPMTAAQGKGTVGRLPLRVSKDGVNRSLILKNLKVAVTFDGFADYPTAAYGTYASMYAGDVLGSSRCVAAMGKPSAQLTGVQNGTVPLTYTVAGFVLGGQYQATISSGNGACTGGMPLSGNAAYTVQVLVKPAVLASGNTPLMLWEMTDPAVGFVADRWIGLGSNIGFESGNNLVYRDGDGKVKWTPSPWATTGYYLVTLTKAAGAVSLTNTKLYMGTTLQTGTLTTTPTGTPNLPSNMKLLLNCTSFDDGSACTSAGTANSLGGTYGFVAVYDRALTIDEISRNYQAIKDAMARSPRSITVQ